MFKERYYAAALFVTWVYAGLMPGWCDVKNIFIRVDPVGMVNHCVVVGCTNYVGKKQGLRFYRLPSEKEAERRPNGQLPFGGKGGNHPNTPVFVTSTLFQVSSVLLLH